LNARLPRQVGANAHTAFTARLRRIRNTLGLLAVPFASYLLISVPINGLFVTGFVLTGGAIFEGSLGAAIAGVSILIAASIAVKMIRRRLAATK
jgi:hypothetical protein